MPQPHRTKVVVDTDIGNDPDDGLTLIYLALHPSCDLLGVTIATGDVQKRAAVAEVFLRACGRSDVPVHCGRRQPLLKGAGQKAVPQYDLIKQRPHILDRPENTAVDFMRRTIRENPNEVVLLTIAPLSNVGLLFALDPEIPSLCKEVVSMCGVYFEHAKTTENYPYEWNILVDETAAGMAFNTPRPRHRFVGLDVTRPCTLWAAEVRERVFKGLGELGKLIQQSGEFWLGRVEKGGRKKDRFTFHDPLAAAVIFEPELCEWKDGRVVIDRGNGGTSLKEGEGTDRVASHVDREGFFVHYFDIVKDTGKQASNSTR
ncbi:putative nucleosidase [Xylariales sp. AK1849]|nr:putative nucleosidase [Xylariales sp. AK1849]